MKKKSNTQEAIVEAAFTLIARHGLKSTSLSMIASEVGISKPAIYYYFSSKEELVDYLFHLVFADHHFSAYFSINEYTKENFKKRLIADGMRYFEEYKHNTPALKVVHEFVLSAAQRPKYEKKLKSIMEHFLEGFDALLSYGVELGVISSQNTKVNAHTLALVIDNLGNFMIFGIEMDYKKIWETAVSHVMKGSE
ncbi:TetR/AcrR family transcriptional regulator [Bacillus swezeyi]|uniref:TetR family transcriptional regulator n=1 Tax=Bacillus swezeyi TaxID=1925020 RepID=A0A1R1QBJ3_9BACI|nr:TetR/AcrR family transcriptional regulator [Bacillus swezeyi]MEC1262231.1 TetR/AcrR family transcriptional regulator [Bacillus swezeyi]MED2927201.1 TetR/AcrR family transcriptional regulator [Bacillus swezeyi]MED2941432.1 TetR/AcrR family transcriptional regulator [Bacillus swezeyi]MED2962399.1 TetR/AcrR family transcriptional regulator [Bacillus swezeyi]MED2977001.1 TetR/AcrR family transcriptional regulator [Bacillus swezeyi]